MADVPESVLSSVTEPAPAIWKPALKEAAWAFLAAAILLVIIYALVFKHIHPEFVRFMGQGAKPIAATGKDFIPVSVGKGRKKGSQYIIEDFNGDEAILALPRGFRAEDYPFIKVNLSGFTRYSKAKILWQQAGDPTTHALEFNRSSDELTQIAMVYGGEAYRGAIDSIALLFYDGPALGFENNNEVDIVIESIEFRAFSAARVANQIFEDWTNPPLWAASSNNTVAGGHQNAMLCPNTVLSLLTALSFLLALIRRSVYRVWEIRRPLPKLAATAICLCLCSWCFNDALRWHWRLEQSRDAVNRFFHKNTEDKIHYSKIRCARYGDCFTESLPHL